MLVHMNKAQSVIFYKGLKVMPKPTEAVTKKSKDLAGYYQILKQNIPWSDFVQSAPTDIVMANGLLIINFAIQQDGHKFNEALNAAGFKLKQSNGGSVFIEGLEAAKLCSEWGGLHPDLIKHLFELSGTPKKEVQTAMQKAPSYWPKDAPAAVLGQSAGGEQITPTDEQINIMLDRLLITAAKMRQHFQSTYKEIINTEMGYLNDISLLNKALQEILGAPPSKEKVNQYLKAYQKQNKTGISHLSVEDMTRIIEITSQLQHHHQELLKAFVTLPETPEAQVKFMQKWLDTLKKTNELYAEYTQLQGKVARSVLPPPYDQVFHKPEYNGLQIGDYLIKPVQRIMKYPLLFAELNKARPPTNPLINVTTMQDNIRDINEQKRTSEDHERVVPQPATTTYVDFKVDIPISGKEERRALKNKLRNEEASVLQALQLPAGVKYSLIKVKKQRGVRADFVLRNASGEDLLQIIVDKKSLSFQELNKGDSDTNLQHIHHLAVELGKPGVVGKIISKDLNKIIKINEMSINLGQAPYTQGQSEIKMIRSKIESEGRSHTTSLSVDAIKIDCAGNTPEQVQEKFKAVIAQRLFVPKLVPQSGIPLPYLAGDVTIDTAIPLLAIKQYESALNAGMTPTFSPVAKRNVNDFLENRLELNDNDMQIRIEVPAGAQNISGRQVLERLKKASSDGFLVMLSPQVEHVLKEYIQTLTADDPILNIDLPKHHSHHALLVNRLFSLGLLPNKEALSAKWLRDEMREDTSLNPQPIVVGSGNIARDFVVIKAAYEEVGKELQISDAQASAMRSNVGDVSKPLQSIDLKRLPSKAQLEAAARLAVLGIAANITADIPQGKGIFIQSENTEHTRVMYERYLGQGFLPKIVNQQIQELSKNGSYINVQGHDPKVLLQRITHCADAGLKVQLTPDQIAMMKRYLQKHSASMTIHGHSWGTVKHNIELANQLGIAIGNLTGHAKSVYLDEVATAKDKNKDLPTIAILPIQSAKSRFLRSDIVSNDRTKTLDFANALLAKGIQISTSGLDVMKAEITAESKKTRWFGWSKSLTKSAKEAQGFLDNQWQQLENMSSQVVQSNSAATVSSIREHAQRIVPPVGLREVTAPSVKQETVSSITPSAEQRMKFMPGSQAKAAAAILPINQHKPDLSIKGVLEYLHQLQNNLRGDLNVGSINPGTYKAISDSVNHLQKALWAAEKELAAGRPHPASNMPEYLKGVVNNPQSHPKLKEAVSSLLERQKAEATEPKPFRRGPAPSA